jgi:RNA polymerase sigma-70 factor (ECF subfamily)
MSDEPTIRAWLAQAAAGDALAVQKLILIHHGRLRTLAAQRIDPQLRGKLEPEDVLQQVYVDVVRRIGEFEYRGPDSFLHWLKSVLEAKLVDFHRHYHAAARDLDREVAEAQMPSGYEALAAHAAIDSLTPSRVIAREEAESLLLAALAGLSDDHRRVLELRYLRGQPLADVAEAMQRSPAAVQMLCGRAIRQLRAVIRQISGIWPEEKRS